jgi:murein DD-endopeptidase MepM/ murein hydrolase activator NlpD
MTGARIPRFAFRGVLGALVLAAAISPARVRAQSEIPAGEVTLTPAVVVAGSPELILVRLPAGNTVEGALLDQKLQFFRSRDGQAWYALAGVDVKAAVGSSTLQITAHTAAGAATEDRPAIEDRPAPAGGPLIDLSRTVEILPAHYRTTTLTVAPKFVEPGPDELARITAERALKDKVFASSATQPLWSGNFRAPVHAPPTDSFGTRRTFNGELASIHEGMDFRAATGTPVRAGNSGVVVLARPLYYEGNCVVIDHGLGLFTISMHLSRIDVHEGDHVIAGQRIGLSGATGRVTGPHLHWAVRWQNAYLDPAKLLRMDLSGVR